MAEFYKNLKENKLFETETLLKVGNLEVHPSVSKISLEGSRGLKGNFRDDPILANHSLENDNSRGYAI